MATGQSFAVLASQSVRQPVNPKTGRTATTYERKYKPEITSRSEKPPGRRQKGSSHKATSVYSDSTPAGHEVEDGTNFYDKLLELKEAHQKTLVMWEKLYKEKNVESESLSPSAVNRSRLASLENLLTSEVPGGIHEHSGIQGRPISVKDHVRDMSYLDVTVADQNYSHPLESDGEQDMTSSVNKVVDRMDRSSDNVVSSCHSSVTGDFTDTGHDLDGIDQAKEDTLAHDHVDTRESAMARIEDMWEKFSVDSYCPRSSEKGQPGLHRSSSMSKISGKSPKQVPERKQATVPKPFSMSLREASQPRKKKTKAALELEQRESEKKRNEVLECQKKFKAMPVPAHVHLRLYDELKEARETRRREIVQHRHKVLQSTQEPFQFSLRDDEKRQSRPNTASRPPSHQFKAHPFPSHIFTDSATEKMLEEEEYRKIRKKMRAKELLRSSSLPPTMKMKGKEYVDGRQRRAQYEARAKDAGLTNEHKFQPRVNSSVPDFDKQYERFMHEMSQRKEMHEATTCKPFNLRTSTQMFGQSRSAKLSRSYADMSENDDSFSGKHQMSKSFRTESYSSCDVIPSRTTRASAVRASATRTRVDRDREKAATEKRRLDEWHSRGQQLQKTIVEKSPNMDSAWLQQEIKKKLHEKRKDEWRRAKSYQQDLTEMKARVKQRPLLFEQAAQRHAGQTADRKYMETLKKSGIDYERLRSQSSVEGSGPAASEYSPRDGLPADLSPAHRSSPGSGGRSPDRESMGHESVSRGSRQASARDYTQDYDDDEGAGSSVVEEEELELEELA